MVIGGNILRGPCGLIVGSIHIITANIIRIGHTIPAIAQIFIPIARPPIPRFLIGETSLILILALATTSRDKIFMAFLYRIEYFFLERHEHLVILL